MLSKIPMENPNPARWKFTNTAGGRGYMEAGINPGLANAMTAAPTIHIATTQLESPDTPAARTRSMERYAQAERTVAALSEARNVVLGGDMSRDGHTDMPFPLPAAAGGGPGDAWTALRPHDGRSSRTTASGTKMYRSKGPVAKAASLRKRTDRFVCKLQDYKLQAIRLIGTERTAGGVLLPRSCHLGMVLTVAVPDEHPVHHHHSTISRPRCTAVRRRLRVRTRNRMELWEEDDDNNGPSPGIRGPTVQIEVK
uniref:Uncharacterized protein n=1 Tax=Oryza brachyantha TaxID=4533 RepID=J3ML87_ORYBR